MCFKNFKIFTYFTIIFLLLVHLQCSFRPSGIDEKGEVVIRSASWIPDIESKNIVEKIADKFKIYHPEIHIEHTYYPPLQYDTILMTAFAAGNAPDVFWVSSQVARPYMSRNALYDLTPLIEEENFDIDDYYPSTIEPFHLNGRYYALSNDACSTVLFYNKELFDAENLPYPNKDWKWEDFVRAAKRLTKDFNGDGKIDQWGFVLPGDTLLWFPFIYSNGGYVFDFDNPDMPLFTQPQALEALDNMLNLALKDRAAPLRGELGDQEVKRGFQLGRVAMMISGWWDMLDTTLNAPDLDYDVAPIPKYKVPGSQTYSTATAIYINTPHPKEAWEFVKFITSAEVQLEKVKAGWAGPSRKSVSRLDYFKDKEKEKVFLEAIEYAYNSYGEHFNILCYEMTVARDRVLQELQTTEEAFKEAEKNFLERIKE